MASIGRPGAAAQWTAAAAAVLASAAALLPWPARAMCDVIPGVTQEFRGALGSVNRPFAIPNDDGEEILVRLRPVCEPDSTGFADLPGGLVPEDDYFVTVLFEPPGGGARNAVVVGTGSNLDRCRALASAAGALPGGGRVSCGETPGGAGLAIQRECAGGARSGEACTSDAACGDGGACLPFRLRFRFPDTDALLDAADDDRTLTGPATIAVTPASDALPLGLLDSRCADNPGLVACIDELYARDGTCETGADHLDPTFGHFTALPPPNDYQALCSTATTGSPCTGLESEARFTVDAAGNALVPMDYRGVLIQADRIPVPRLIQGDTKLPAFAGSALPVAIPSEAFLSSWAPGGQKLPPIFTPIADPSAADALALFGSVDAPVGVIRVQRRGCAGGDDPGRTCTQDAECGTGATCRTLFDFSDRLSGGVGPVLVARAGDELRLDAQSPVPLDGLIESESLFAFVANEAIGEPQDDCDGDGIPDCTRLNDDSDGTDPVLRLRDRATGEVLRIGTHGTEGRAVTRTRDGRFRFPAVTVEGDLVAFLELEPLEGDCADPVACDSNGDGSVFDPILRVFRFEPTPGISGCASGEVTCGLDIAVDAAPLVNGRSVAISEGRVYFRTPEWRNARKTTERGPPGWLQLLSYDGRFLAFSTDGGAFVLDRSTGASERVSSEGAVMGLSDDARFVSLRFTSTTPGNIPFHDVYVHDRATGATERLGLQINGFLPFEAVHALSGDGRSVVFPQWSNISEPVIDVFVHDLATGARELVSVSSAGARGLGYSSEPVLSGNGQIVAFTSDAGNLVADDTNVGGVFVHDRATGTTERVSISSDGNLARGAFGPALSDDGRIVAFTGGNDLVPGDTNSAFDVYVHDRETGATERASVASDGSSGNAESWQAALSDDGRIVAFTSRADNLVSGDTNGAYDVFVHDRVTGATERVSVASDGSQIRGFSQGPALSGDGRVVIFCEAGECFFRGPATGDLGADSSGDGLLDDVVLEVLDTTVSPAQRRTLLPAAEVVVAGGSAAFLVPTRRGTGRVHLSVGGAAPRDLGKEARALAISEDLVAALVPDIDEETTHAELYQWTQDGAVWRALPGPAEMISVAGSTVAFLGAGRQVTVYRADQDRLIETGQAAEQIVHGERLVAFGTREATQGVDLNGDGDLSDDVLQVFDLVSERFFNTAQTVTPCPLEACDPRFPYRVDGDTVVYITAEAEQGGRDLNGDGDATDLVKQVFNAREAARLLPGGGTAAGCTRPIASASAGICTTTGTACATDAECGGGTCYLPPGGCIEDLGTCCDLDPEDGRTCGSGGGTCGEGEFCSPKGATAGLGTCHANRGPCASQSDCSAVGGTCTDGGAEIQRLIAPVARDAVASSGTCVEPTGAACTSDAECTAPGLCGPSGRCERRHGSCVTGADCAEGLLCAPNLVTVAAADADGDALLDPLDNCPEVANADQADFDGDRVGDACDLRSCGNGIHESAEACDDRNQQDGDGCSSACEIENAAPACGAARPSVAILWPADHELRSVGIRGVADPDGDPLELRITAIAQDERLDEKGAGATCPDASGLGSSSARLRAERSGGGDGRVYRIRFQADDGRGGRCEGAVRVCVPHDRGKRSCGEGAFAFDSTQPCNGNGKSDAAHGNR